MNPEFSRPVAVDRIGPAGLDIELSARAEECAALAARMRLPAIAALACRFQLRAAPGGAVAAAGWLRAELTQTCIVSLDDFPAVVAEAFEVRFVRAGSEAEDPDIDAIDEIPFAGGTIDLGEAAAEQLALALDPYPRKPGAELPAGMAEPAANPFARLAALRRGG